MFGNDALGIHVNRQVVSSQMNYIDAGLPDALGNHIKAVLIHELTHLHKKDFSEIAEFAMNLMLDPKHNERSWNRSGAMWSSWISKQ